MAKLKTNTQLNERRAVLTKQFEAARDEYHAMDADDHSARIEKLAEIDRIMDERDAVDALAKRQPVEEERQAEIDVVDSLGRELPKPTKRKNAIDLWRGNLTEADEWIEEHYREYSEIAMHYVADGIGALGDEDRRKLIRGTPIDTADEVIMRCAVAEQAGQPFDRSALDAAQATVHRVDRMWTDLAVANRDVVAANRAADTTTATWVGDWVPSRFVVDVIRYRLAGFPLGNDAAVRMIRVPNGVGSLIFPTSNWTAVSASVKAENADATEVSGSAGDFTLITNTMHLYSELSEESVIKSAVPLMPEVRRGYAEARLRTLNEWRTKRAATGTPKIGIVGITEEATKFKTGGATTLPTADQYLEMPDKVDLAYHDGAYFQVTQAERGRLRRLKISSSDSRYLIGQSTSLAAGDEDMIRGYPLRVNQHLDSTAADENVIAIFGSPGRYYRGAMQGMPSFRTRGTIKTYQVLIGMYELVAGRLEIAATHVQLVTEA